MKFFPGQGIFVDGQGNLERTWKVREKIGNLKINRYGRQSSENLFILFMRWSKPNFSSLGATLKGKNFAHLGSKFFPLRVTSKIEVLQLAPLK